MDKESFRKLCYSFNEKYDGIDIDNIEALAMRNDVSIPDAVDVAKEFFDEETCDNIAQDLEGFRHTTDNPTGIANPADYINNEENGPHLFEYEADEPLSEEEQVEADKEYEKALKEYEKKRDDYIDSIPFEAKAYYKNRINDYFDNKLKEANIIKPIRRTTKKVKKTATTYW